MAPHLAFIDLIVLILDEAHTNYEALPYVFFNFHLFYLSLEYCSFSLFRSEISSFLFFFRETDQIS